MKQRLHVLNKPMIFLLIMLAAIGGVEAQTPSDAVMMKQGEICLALMYNHNSWEEYWEGDSLRTNGNIGTVTTQTVMPGFQLGILDRLNLFVMAPYVITKSEPAVNPITGLTTATMVGEQGFQDLALFLKGSVVHNEGSKGTLDVLATVGFSMPMSSYTPDATFPIGLGCPDGIFRGIVQYTTNSRVYGRMDAAYHLRGSSELIRTYYYSTNGYYTNEIDMPDAVDYNITLGWWILDNQLKAEAQFNGLTTLGGFDIRRQDGGFPSNDMEAQRIGINAEYYNLFIDGLGLSFNSAYTIAGRNVGKSLSVGGGVLYFFNLWNPSEAAEESKP